MSHLIQVNFATVILVVFLFVYIMTNSYFDGKIRKLYLTACLLVLCLVIADSVEHWTASFDHLVSLRIWMSAIGYSLRPTIFFTVIVMLLRENKKSIVWLSLPLYLNALLAFSAFFTEIAYSYSDDNQFVRGPLGYFAFVTNGFYAVALMICTVKQYRTVNRSEARIAMVALCMFVIATVMESAWGFDGLINTSGVVALVFYYIHLNTQHFKRDSLTQVLNRRCFFLDGEKHEASLSAVVSVDLNNLKKWNDEYGHAKGDEAICTLVGCIQKVLPRTAHLYRTGGDEFMVLCFDMEKKMVQQFLNDIRSEMEKTPFSCAIGMAYRDEGQAFDKLCLEADQKMYCDKKRFHSESSEK